MAAMGRPTKLTEELTKVLCDAIRAGNYRNVACAVAGISQATFSVWMRSTEPEYLAFQASVDEAEAQCEARLVAIVARDAAKDARMALELLGRKYPERWAVAVRNRVAGFDGGPIVFSPVSPLDYTQLTTEELQTLERLSLKAAAGSGDTDNVSYLGDAGGTLPA